QRRRGGRTLAAAADSVNHSATTQSEAAGALRGGTDHQLGSTDHRDGERSIDRAVPCGDQPCSYILGLRYATPDEVDGPYALHLPEPIVGQSALVADESPGVPDLAFGPNSRFQRAFCATLLQSDSASGHHRAEPGTAIRDDGSAWSVRLAPVPS